MNFKTIVGVVILLLVAVFSVQNSEVISVHFLGWRFDWSEALVILVAASAGVLVGLLLGAFGLRRSPKSSNPSA